MEENYTIIKQNYQILDKTFNDFKAMLQQGVIEESDVDQMAITRSTLENTMKNIENQKNISLKLLKFQLGIPLEQEIKLTDSIAMYVETQPTLLTSGTGFSIDNNIDFKIMKTNEAAQLLLLKQQKSKVLPSLVAVYRYQGQKDEPAINFTPKNVLAVQMDIPIFASGARNSRISQAKLNLEKTKVQVQQVEQGLKLEAEQANAEYANSYNSYVVLKENLALSKRIYDKTLIKYNTGVASSFDLNTAQNQYLSMLSNYYTSIINLLNAKQHIEKLKN
jgi:outer membrane protein TolC